MNEKWQAFATRIPPWNRSSFVHLGNFSSNCAANKKQNAARVRVMEFHARKARDFRKNFFPLPGNCIDAIAISR